MLWTLKNYCGSVIIVVSVPTTCLPWCRHDGIVYETQPRNLISDSQNVKIHISE